MTISDILNRLKRVKQAGNNQWSASCPCSTNHSHDDRNQSLSIKYDSETDRILMFCHTGCSIAEICAAINCEVSDLSGKDNNLLAHVKWYAKQNNLQFVDMYSYCYDGYNDGLTKIRFMENGKKTFRWVRNEPANKSGFKWNREGCAHRLYVAGSIHDDTIILVEGEKDANSVHHVFGFTSASVENGASTAQAGKKWLPEYNQQLTGKNVYIIGDNDEVGKKFLQTEAKQLSDSAQSVLIMELGSVWPECPEKGDITDLIQSVGVEKARELFGILMENAKPFCPSQETALTTEKQSGKKDYRELVYDLVDCAKIRQFGNALYRLVDGKYYKFLSDVFINHELIAIRGMDPEKQKSAQTIIRACQQDQNIEFERYYVGFKNGVMNWRTCEFFPYGELDVPIFRYIDLNYNPEADTTFIDGIITDWCQGDDLKKEMLYELAGCCLYSDKAIKRWWVIEGKADSGKTTFLQLLNRMLGKNNVGNTPIQKLKDTNAIAELIDKPVNIVDDGSSKFTTDLSNLRRIIQGDDIQVKLLYQNLFSVRLESRMVFVFNKAPRFRDDNGATAKKMLVIGFNRVYGSEEKDTDLINKLTSEENLEAFVSIAIDRMKKILSRNIDFTVSDESRKFVAQIVEESDQFASFVADTISDDYGWKEFLGSMRTDDVFATFKAWALDEGYQNILVRKQFTERCCAESGAKIRRSHGKNFYSFDD